MNQLCTRDNPLEFKISDCLACAGCISTEEIGFFVSDMNFKEKLEKSTILITKESKVFIYLKLLSILHKDIDFKQFELIFCTFLKKQLEAEIVVDTSYFQSYTNNVLSSDCPATVLYIEKIYPNLKKYLNTYSTQMQLAYNFVKTKKNNVEGKIIFISHCYDMKDETRRDIAASHIDYFLGINDFYQLYKDNLNDYFSEEFNILERLNSKNNHLPVNDSQYKNCMSYFTEHPWEKSYRTEYRCSAHSKVHLKDICNKEIVSGKLEVLAFLNKMNKDRSGFYIDENCFVILHMCEGKCTDSFPVNDVKSFISTHIKESSPNKEYYFLLRKFSDKKKKTFNINW